VEDLGISTGLFATILTESFVMWHVSIELIPQILLAEQDEHQLNMRTNVLQKKKTEADVNFIKLIATGNET
jgi:hypothetical protein